MAGTVVSVGKVISSFVGIALIILNQVLPVLPDNWKVVANAIIGVLTLVATFYAPYAPLGSARRSVAKPAGKKRGKVGSVHVPVTAEVTPVKPPQD